MIMENRFFSDDYPLFLLEKDFFDTDDSVNDTNLDTENPNDIEDNEVDEQDERQLSLSLKYIWIYTQNLSKLVKRLYLINQDFENEYYSLQRLIRIQRDFILNYETFDKNSKLRFVKLCKKALSVLIKQVRQKIAS